MAKPFTDMDAVTGEVVPATAEQTFAKWDIRDMQLRERDGVYSLVATYVPFDHLAVDSLYEAPETIVYEDFLGSAPSATVNAAKAFLEELANDLP